MKCKCGNRLFLIQNIPCCDDCSENPAFIRNEETVGGYWKAVYDEKEIEEKGLKREGAEYDGECRVGYAYGAGCELIICPKCHWTTNFPMSDSCGY